MSFTRQIIIMVVLVTLFGCSTRQAFQETSGKQDTGWWKCDPKGERDWSCTDGQEVRETQDLIASLPEQKAIEDTVQPAPESFEPIEVETIETTYDDTAEAIADEVAETVVAEAIEPVEAVVDEVVAEEAIAETVDTKPESTQPKGDWVIQLGAFRSESEAQKLADRIPNAQVNPATSDSWYRVVWGEFFSREAAEQAASDLKQDYSGLNTWVRKN